MYHLDWIRVAGECCIAVQGKAASAIESTKAVPRKVEQVDIFEQVFNYQVLLLRHNRAGESSRALQRAVDLVSSRAREIGALGKGAHTHTLCWHCR
ncbi:hypothetical protein GOP47_0000129 [Adiantum capillus-veneris]|uniref:Uncharacterized protein n=1 Tax=Adiantum capillus-veneris TaxID=13818 RepID=A0A9D4VDD1_ADICA|nr:hypothetical protein GOP47_0000129 [Adiantum capillus-veneris]